MKLPPASMVANAPFEMLARPFLKWAGGKSQLISQYLPHFPAPETYRTYYEPFIGGGAIFFHLQPQAAVLTDINPELVNVYCCVRNQVEMLILHLEQHQKNHSPTYYYHIRSLGDLSEIERAARLIYLNKTCFNGLYRENSKGEFNVPLGRYQNPKVYDPNLLRAVSLALRSVTLEVRSFERVLQDAHGPQDFVYFDPPYYPLNPTSSFTGYSRSTFTAADQVQLREVFAELTQRGVQVMLSNSDCDFIRELYRDFRILTISASRNINSQATKRGKITEVLVLSNPVHIDRTYAVGERENKGAAKLERTDSRTMRR
ncbi:DNA adenine methylase [Neosynechococcus sphagnicola]|uniref:DNA adenine methylase n=1 Tax=Neosynechococcus sphagnicola TaxID=1501145 RepID=UPI00090771E2|nr:DNA adenine methylase [Neosynechococcus sphagnicola]